MITHVLSGQLLENSAVTLALIPDLAAGAYYAALMAIGSLIALRLN